MSRLLGGKTVVLWLLLVLGVSLEGVADDWPMYRHDSARGATTKKPLPENLTLQWTREAPLPRPAWPASQTRLQFDAHPEPVVAGSFIFVPSTVNDCVTAFHTHTGEMVWRFTSDGPVRCAPIATADKVYFVSDDGFLYCLDHAGKLQWKVRGGPQDRPVWGNERLISSWCARGAPVLHQGVVYFAAGIWPFMGVFIHAIDAESGETVWTNSGDSMNFITHPHGAKAFGTVAPQGYLAAKDGRLFVPGGRSMPAVYDLETGALEYFPYDKRHGGHEVSVSETEFYVSGRSFRLHDGADASTLAPVLLTDSTVTYLDKDRLAVASQEVEEQKEETTDRNGKKQTKIKRVRERLASATVAGVGRVYLQAGSTVYSAKGDKIAAHHIGQGDQGAIKPSWSAEVKGPVHTMLAADDRLFVVAGDSTLYCFGAQKTEPVHHQLPQPKPSAKGDASPDLQQVLKHPSAQEGIGVIYGAENAELIDTLLANTSLHLIVIDAKASAVAALRERMQSAGLYGRRIAARRSDGDPAAFPLPPYVASVIIGANPSYDYAANEAHWFAGLRPYGGAAFLPSSTEQHAAFQKAKHDPQAAIERQGRWTVTIRKGQLPGAADWSHQYAGPGQTCVSQDTRVKAPFGILWWGGPSNDDVLPRHGHGPSPQVAGGRVIVEGPNMVRAIDAYTGRQLWRRDLPDVGEYFNVTAHFAGAGETGSNYISLADRIYVIYGQELLELKAATGATERTFTYEDANGKPHQWGFVAEHNGLLITAASAIESEDGKASPKRQSPGSRVLIVYDRSTGKKLWSRDAELNFRHNNIAVGDGKVFCLDKLTDARLKALQRRGFKGTGTPTFYALDARTGKVIWKDEEHVFGTFVNYSAEHDLVLQAGSLYRDRAKDEHGKGMVAYQGSTGDVLWSNDLSYGGPCLLWKDRIITNGSGGFSVDIKTGKATGWRYSRMYGCNTAVGGQNLLTFRSGAAGYYDLATNSGTGNVGGFRSSCTNNLIIGDGLLNAPDYTRTCSCAYQNQTSVALVHMPEAELWAFGEQEDEKAFGVNLSAPGDRREPSGVLWRPWDKLEHKGEQAERFRVHSSQVPVGPLPWVAASGVAGLTEIEIPVEFSGPAQVRLVFYDPEGAERGKRVFDIVADGKTLESDFDISGVVKHPHSSVVRTYKVEVTKGQFQLTFNSKSEAPPVLSGVEIVAQEEGAKSP